MGLTTYLEAAENCHASDNFVAQIGPYDRDWLQEYDSSILEDALEVSADESGI